MAENGKFHFYQNRPTEAAVEIAASHSKKPQSSQLMHAHCSLQRIYYLCAIVLCWGNSILELLGL